MGGDLLGRSEDASKDCGLDSSTLICNLFPYCMESFEGSECLLNPSFGTLTGLGRISCADASKKGKKYKTSVQV